MLLRTYLFIFFACTCLNSFSGNPDSLINLSEKQSGEDRINTLNKISTDYRKTNIDKSEQYAKLAIKEANEVLYKKGLGDAYNNLGGVENVKGNYNEAIDYYLKSFLYRQQIKDTIGMGNTLSNIGVMYRKLSEFEKALEYYQKALNIKEKLNNPSEVLHTLNNIGSLFYFQQNHPKAKEYYTKSLEKAKQISDSVLMGAAYNNLGLVYTDEGNYPEAISYLDKALKVREILEDENGQAVSFNNLGRVFEKQNSFEKALRFYKKASILYVKTNDYPNYANCTFNIGSLFLNKGDFKEAVKYLEKSLEISKELDSKLQLRDIYNRLGIVYHKLGKHNDSYLSIMKYIELNEAIFESTSMEKISEMEVKYQTKKKNEENELLKKENELKDLQRLQNEQKQRFTQFAFIGGLIIVLSIALIFYVRYNTKKKSSEKLEKYNKEILHQKLIVEDKNKEITDSINYAQKIQAAILPSEDIFKSFLPHSFILFKPKDIVSGDFYWISKKDKYVFFAAVDCTGHGVPGGFMSVLGSSLLEEAINEKNIKEPKEVLNQMRTKIIHALRQTGASGENKDGMDLALCRLDTAKMNLTYSGANNNLYLVREGVLTEYKASSQPVGINIGINSEYLQYEIDLKEEDMIYIFTDGYADQFGGEKGKKFKYKQFENLLINISTHSLKKQKEIINDVFEKWKGNLEQIDDVCVIGVRV